MWTGCSTLTALEVAFSAFLHFPLVAVWVQVLQGKLWLGTRPKVVKTLGESSLRLGGRAWRVTMVVGPCLGGNGGDAYSM